MAINTMAYGVVLAALGFVIQQINPGLANVMLIAGGGLSLLWGVVAWAGYTRRTWAFLTLIAVLMVLLRQSVSAWSYSTIGTSGGMGEPLLLTLLILLTVGMLMYVLHGERPPEFYSKGTARWDSAESRRDVDPSTGGGHHR